MRDERGPGQRGSCGSVDGGFTIALDDEKVRAFMEAGDYSSASELERFADVGAHVERRLKEGSGAAFLALSIGEKGLSRDFAILQVAHHLAKRGKKVLVVDCDFLHPGLSGLVENLEEHGFLDLLLYGSSLKSVAKGAGIDGVSVAGPGSFPVSRTIPFALKEFGKIRDFLRSKHDVVFYCSTLRTEDGRINPLAPLVDGIVVCCRIEDLGEGELEQHLAALAAEHPAPVELVCFCGERAVERAAAPAAHAEVSQAAEMPHIETAPAEERAEEAIPAPVLEAASEIETIEERPRRRLSVARIVAVAGALVVAAFAIWWFAVYRTVQEETSVRPGTTPPAGEAGIPASSDTGAAPSRIDSAAALAAAESSAAEQRREEATLGAPAAATPERAPTTRLAPAETTAVAKPPAGPARYTIHIASFKEQSRAEAEEKMLEGYGYETRIVEVTIGNERWLRVFAGSYATSEEADAARLQLLGLRGVGYARVVRIDAMTK